MGEMSILSARGDDKYIWDPEDEQSVQRAQKTFDGYIKDGWVAFEVGKGGKKTSRKVEEFDAELGKVIFVRQMGGG